MRSGAVWTLAVAVVISALLVVNVRHQHRLAYVQYQAQANQRDSLNDEWGQLLVEENLWSSAHRIEKHAGEQLSMRPPKKDEMQIVGHKPGGDVELATAEVTNAAR